VCGDIMALWGRKGRRGRLGLVVTLGRRAFRARTACPVNLVSTAGLESPASPASKDPWAVRDALVSAAPRGSQVQMEQTEVLPRTAHPAPTVCRAGLVSLVYLDCRVLLAKRVLRVKLVLLVSLGRLGSRDTEV